MHRLKTRLKTVTALLGKTEMVDNQSAFWPLHPYVYGKTFPAFPFSPATATVATERKNGNSTTARHNGTAKRQQRNGNGRTATEWWKPGISVPPPPSLLLRVARQQRRRAAKMINNGRHWGYGYWTQEIAEIVACNMARINLPMWLRSEP